MPPRKPAEETDPKAQPQWNSEGKQLMISGGLVTAGDLNAEETVGKQPSWDVGGKKMSQSASEFVNEALNDSDPLKALVVNYMTNAEETGYLEHVGEGLTPQSDWGTGVPISNYAALAVAQPPPPQVMRLYESGIIEIDNDNEITWRTGHLEHIANLYNGDPVTTERNYADDLAVARAYSAETWAKLIETPQT